MKKQTILLSLFLLGLTVVVANGYQKETNKSMPQDTSGPAYAVTWQNDSGYWFAVGPVQALWSGEKEEEKAIEMVRGYQSEKKGEVKLIDHCGKFYVYSLGVDYNSYDTDAIKYARKKGYSCDWP